MTRTSDRSRIETEGRALVERLGGRWTASGGLCRCPAHDDRTPSLSVRPGARRLLLHCFAGCSSARVLDAILARGLIARSTASPDASDLHDSGDASVAAAARIWQSGRTVEGTPAAAYLAARGLATASPELRFNPRTPHGAWPLTRFRPALVAAVRDDCGLTGVHRTFLDESGTGSPPAPRRAGLGRFGAGAVRLGRPDRCLGLAEGIETALSATSLFGVPCWATLGTGRFAHVSIPACVAELHLFPDHDCGGRRAEAFAREAFAHLRIHVHLPPRPGDDWNDVLRASTGAPVGGRGEEARGR